MNSDEKTPRATQGKPVAVPPLVLESGEDRRRSHDAGERLLAEQKAK